MKILLAYTFLVLFCTFSMTLSGNAVVSEIDAEKRSPLKVVILAGQSNAQSGVTAELTEAQKRPQVRVPYFYMKSRYNEWKGSDYWDALEPEGKQFGFELTMGGALVDMLGEEVGIIKWAVGGSDLATEWDPDSKRKDEFYGKLLSGINNAKTKRPIEIIGMVWMQGESDCNQKYAPQYRANLANFIRRVRADLNHPELPFVCGRINPHYKNKEKVIELVRSAQRDPGLERVGWVDCDDIEQKDDRLHFSTRGQLNLGIKFAESLNKLLESTK